MKKLLKFFLLSAAVFLVLHVPASAASLQDNLVPQDKGSKIVGEVELEYNEFPQHHYELDTWVDTDGDWLPWNWAEGAGKQIYIALMEIINAIWSVNILLANFTMLIVQEAFKLDFVSNVTDEIGTAIQNIAGFGTGGFMANGLWPLLITFIIGIVGAWATYVGLVKRESSRAWSGLLSSIIIFVFALGFFSNSPVILKQVNKWSSDLQSNILSISASIVQPGSSYSKDEGIATIRNQMFDLMVKKPYMLMQYGTTKVEDGRVNSLLSIDPYLNAEDRNLKAQEEVEQQKNNLMSIDGISQRAGFVPLLFIANSIIGIFLLIVSGAILLYQMVFLTLVLFAPVPLLMALVPRWQQSAVNWIMKVLHAQLMKIAIALLLTILFGISAILYRATETSDLGYLGMMLLQILCFVGVWAKRKDLFGLVSTAVSNVESMTGSTLQGYKQKYNQIRNINNKKNRMGDNQNQGRIRNQPLAQRKIGYLNKEQQADRKKQLQFTKDKLASGASGVMLADRTNQELQEGQGYNANLLNRNGVENANVDREQLMDRKADSLTENQKMNRHGVNTSRLDGVHSRSQIGSPDTKVSPVDIDDFRRQKGLANAPLEDRHRNESAAALEQRPEIRDTELTDRTQTERNVNLMDQNSHEDRINGQQNTQLSERRTLEQTTDREVSQDNINRERLINNNTERNINDTVDRQSISNEGNERNIQDTVNRQSVSNEGNERNIQDTVNRQSTNTERNERTVTNVSERNNNVTETNVNREQSNVSRIIENAKQNDKPLTKWEAEQQIKARRNEE